MASEGTGTCRGQGISLELYERGDDIISSSCIHCSIATEDPQYLFLRVFTLPLASDLSVPVQLRSNYKNRKLSNLNWSTSCFANEICGRAPSIFSRPKNSYRNPLLSSRLEVGLLTSSNDASGGTLSPQGRTVSQCFEGDPRHAPSPSKRNAECLGHLSCTRNH